MGPYVLTTSENTKRMRLFVGVLIASLVLAAMFIKDKIDYDSDVNEEAPIAQAN
jgi:hypothetical protein